MATAPGGFLTAGLGPATAAGIFLVRRLCWPLPTAHRRGSVPPPSLPETVRAVQRPPRRAPHRRRGPRRIQRAAGGLRAPLPHTAAAAARFAAGRTRLWDGPSAGSTAGRSTATWRGSTGRWRRRSNRRGCGAPRRLRSKERPPEHRRVLLFAGAREAAGASQFELVSASGATASVFREISAASAALRRCATTFAAPSTTGVRQLGRSPARWRRAGVHPPTAGG